MKKGFTVLLIATTILYSCDAVLNKKQLTNPVNNEVIAIGAMKNVMWKGKLAAEVKFDTFGITKTYVGLGPASYLQGELILINGDLYKGTVRSDSTMDVIKTTDTGAPFFVYANVTNWKEYGIPSNVNDDKALEKYLDSIKGRQSKPYAFRISGKIQNASIHLQNLPDGTEVKSPKEAHQGQVSYNLTDRDVEIIGFFSRNHGGIYTHHDSFIHMHLLTKDKEMMGHVDLLEFDYQSLKLQIAE